jgi:hypothetical protein
MLNFEVAQIHDVTDAKIVATALRNNYWEKDYAQRTRDAVNGALEAFFVSDLRDANKETLLDALNTLKADFGDLNAFKRAVARVQAFRPKNKAWKTFTV